jgi:hypothetical protein
VIEADGPLAVDVDDRGFVAIDQLDDRRAAEACGRNSPRAGFVGTNLLRKN